MLGPNDVWVNMGVARVLSVGHLNINVASYIKNIFYVLMHISMVNSTLYFINRSQMTYNFSNDCN